MARVGRPGVAAARRAVAPRSQSEILRRSACRIGVPENTLVLTSNFRHTVHMIELGPPRARALRRFVAWTMSAAILIGGMAATAPAASAAGTTVAAAGQPVASQAVERSAVKSADLSRFQAGNIISDAAFFNAGTMSEAQIQSFLQSKVPTCQSG